jgi:hypothetical protein
MISIHPLPGETCEEYAERARKMAVADWQSYKDVQKLVDEFEEVLYPTDPGEKADD